MDELAQGWNFGALSHVDGKPTIGTDPKIIDYLQANFDVHQIKDFTKRELHGEILEGTGSMVFDHLHKVAYACLSERTSRGLFEEVCHFWTMTLFLLIRVMSMGMKFTTPM